MRFAAKDWYMKHATHGEIAYEPADEMVFVRLDNGKVDLSIYMCNECSSEQGLIDAMTAWIEDEATAIIAPHFTIAAPVDYLIEGHQMPAYDNAIDECARPVFDAIRREMLEQVARIDALQFKTPTV